MYTHIPIFAEDAGPEPHFSKKIMKGRAHRLEINISIAPLTSVKPIRFLQKLQSARLL